MIASHVRQGLLVLFLAATALTSTAFINITVSTEKEPLYTLNYIKSLSPLGGQKLYIDLTGVPGDAVTCVSLYGWWPNGTINQLAKTCSRGGEVALPAFTVKRYFAAWMAELARTGTDPRHAHPGVIAMLAVTEPGKGVYGRPAAFALDPVLVAKRGLSVRIVFDSNIVKDMLAEPLIPWSNLEKTMRSQEWPPEEVPTPGEAAYWFLRSTLGEKQDVGIPVEIVHLSGYLGYFKNNYLILAETFKATTVYKVWFSGLYTTSVQVGGVSVVDSPGVAGPVFELESDVDHLYLNLGLEVYYTGQGSPLVEGRGVSGSTATVEAGLAPRNGEVLASVGYVGDVAYAEYCLAIDYPYNGQLVPVCVPLGSEGVYANLTLHRPHLTGNRIIYWYEVDNDPHDGVGITEGAYRALKARWALAHLETASGYIRITDLATSSRFETASVLSVTVPVVPLLVGAAEGPTPIYTPILGASLGYTYASSSASLTSVSITGKSSENDTIYDIYVLHDPQKYYFDGHWYELGTTLYDVEVYKAGAAPHPCPPGGACPTGGEPPRS